MVVIRLRCSLPAYHSKPSLICDFCSSDQRFAYSFLQIPPHGRHPCCLAIHFPLPGHVRDSHPLERAHGAQTKKNRLFMRLFQIKVELTGVEPVSKSSPTFKLLQFSSLLDKTTNKSVNTHSLNLSIHFHAFPIDIRNALSTWSWHTRCELWSVADHKTVLCCVIVTT